MPRLRHAALCLDAGAGEQFVPPFRTGTSSSRVSSRAGGWRPEAAVELRRGRGDRVARTAPERTRTGAALIRRAQGSKAKGKPRPRVGLEIEIAGFRAAQKIGRALRATNPSCFRLFRSERRLTARGSSLLRLAPPATALPPPALFLAEVTLRFPFPPTSKPGTRRRERARNERGYAAVAARTMSSATALGFDTMKACEPPSITRVSLERARSAMNAKAAAGMFRSRSP